MLERNYGKLQDTNYGCKRENMDDFIRITMEVCKREKLWKIARYKLWKVARKKLWKFQKSIFERMQERNLGV